MASAKFEKFLTSVRKVSPPEQVDHRQMRVNLDRTGGKFPDGVVGTPVVAGGVPAEWIDPAGGVTDRVMLYLHGGGYVAGSIDSHRNLTGHLAPSHGVPSPRAGLPPRARASASGPRRRRCSPVPMAARDGRSRRARGDRRRFGRWRADRRDVADGPRSGPVLASGGGTDLALGPSYTSRAGAISSRIESRIVRRSISSRSGPRASRMMVTTRIEPTSPRTARRQRLRAGSSLVPRRGLSGRRRPRSADAHRP